MSTRRALALSFLDRYASLVVNIVSSMLIARLLKPSEIGTFSIAMVLIGFLNTFRDFGAGQYVVQEKALDREKLRAAWSVLIGIGAGFALLTCLAAYPVALFYQDTSLVPILLLLALGFAINPFSSLVYAVLSREMQFAPVALIRLSANLSQALVSIFLAWRGFGPLALAYGALASVCAAALTAQYFRPPGLPMRPSKRGLKQVMSFGGQMSLISLLNGLLAGLPELFLGKWQGMAAAGLYSRAGGLIQMFFRLVLDAVYAIALPAFAKIERQNADMTQAFLRATAHVTLLGWSFCAMLVLMAHPIVRVLYGTQWDAAVPLVRLGAAALAITLPAALCSQPLLAAGRATAALKATTATTVLSACLAAVGARHSMLATSVALLIAAPFTLAFWLHALRGQLRFSLAALLQACAPSAASAAIAAIGPGLVILAWGLEPSNSIVALMLASLATALLLVLALHLTQHPMNDELHKLLASARRKLGWH